MSTENTSANPTDVRVREVLEGMKRVAVVGLSAKEDRASHGIAKFLLGQGYQVVGVNPVLKEPVLGLDIYPSLADVPGPVDVVDIFRRSETVGPIIEEAVARGDGFIWMQEHVINEDAAQVARSAGIDVIQDRCIYKEWLRLLNG